MYKKKHKLNNNTRPVMQYITLLKQNMTWNDI